MCLQNLIPPIEITRFDSCDSTNQQLLSAAENGAPCGSVYVTHEQTAGRGRRGRNWIAEPGRTLTLSLLWTFPMAPAALNGLSLAVGVAMMQALESPELGKRLPDCRMGLKWPNDILLRRQGKDAKLGGILVESVVRRNANHGDREIAVVIGIGLNCLSSPGIDSAVTDQSVAALGDACTIPMAPEMMLPIVLNALVNTLSEFSDHGFGALRDVWHTAHLWQDESVRISEGGKPLLDGRVQGVDRDGALLITTPTGVERVITGDVSLRKV